MDPASWAALAATTFVASLLYAVSGFGFAVLAAPLFLVLVEPTTAIQLIIILSTALALAVVPGLRRAVAAGLLLRLAIGSLAGLPIGLLAFLYGDQLLVRAGAGATILAFAIAMAVSWRRRGQPRGKYSVAMSAGRDLMAGAVSGIASALVGMAGPPVLIYLLLAGAPPSTVRATLLSFFALSYGATLASHIATIGVPRSTWLIAASLVPVAFIGGFAGRPIGDRLGTRGFTVLAIALLSVAGLYTLITALVGLVARQQ